MPAGLQRLSYLVSRFQLLQGSMASLFPPCCLPTTNLPTASLQLPEGLCPILGLHSPKSPPPSVPSCPCSGCGLLESPTSSSRSDKSVQGPRRLHPGAKLQFSLVTSLVFASL